VGDEKMVVITRSTMACVAVVNGQRSGDWGLALRHYIFIQQRSTVAEPDMISSQMLEKINMLFTGQGRSILNTTGTAFPYVGFPAGK